MLPAHWDSEITRRLQASYSYLTSYSYQRKWQIFQAFADSLQQSSLPCEPQLLALHIEALYSSGTARTELERRISVVRIVHRLFGHANPATSLVRDVFIGLCRETVYQEQHQNLFSPEQVRKLVLAISIQRTIDYRDRAILLLTYAGALDLDDLMTANRDDVSFGNSMQVRLKSRLVRIPSGSAAETCPVYAMQEWLSVSKEMGPLFYELKGRDRSLLGGRRLEPGSFQKIMSRRRKAVGLGLGYTLSSLKTSCLVNLLKNGVSAEHVSHHTGAAPETVSSYLDKLFGNAADPYGTI